MMTDRMHGVHLRAAGPDVHKMLNTAPVRLCAGAGEAQVGRAILARWHYRHRSHTLW